MEDSLLAERELSAALDAAYRELELAFMELLTSHPPSRRQATFLLRCARQIRQLPPKRKSDDAPILSLAWFAADFVPRLHLVVANEVLERTLEDTAAGLRARRWEGKVLSRPLWEGEGGSVEGDLLPVQPSPVVFRFLHKLVGAMGRVGEDVWTPAAVKAVKAGACNGVWAALEEVLQGREVVNFEDLKEAKEEINEVKEEVKEIDEEAAEEVKENEFKEEDPKEATGAIKDGGSGSNEAGEATKLEEDTGDKLEDGNAARPDTRNDESNNADAEASSKPEKDVESSLTNPEPAPETANAAATSKPIITRDWTLQLLFDALYLDEALHRKRRRGSGNPVVSLVGKVDSFIGTKVIPILYDWHCFSVANRYSSSWTWTRSCG